MKKLVKGLLRVLTYRLGFQNLDFLNLLLESRLAKASDFVLVQIGANDGRTNDPVHAFLMRHKSQVRGYLLEPLPDLFAELQETYRDCPNVKTLKLAIHNTKRSVVLHRVVGSRLEDLPSFARGIASVDPEHHLKSSIPSDAIVNVTVPAISLRDLVEQERLGRVDFLCMDTEGYDAEILLSLDFEYVRPAVIMFEHGLRHGVMSDSRFSQVLHLLNDHGYDVMIQDYDAIAYERGRLAVG